MLTVPLYIMAVFDRVLTSRSEETASLPQFPRFSAN
jgi:ABC-type protease/lipase transport system fused ATPase/permease subunit